MLNLIRRAFEGLLAFLAFVTVVIICCVTTVVFSRTMGSAVIGLIIGAVVSILVVIFVFGFIAEIITMNRYLEEISKNTRKQ